MKTSTAALATAALAAAFLALALPAARGQAYWDPGQTGADHHPGQAPAATAPGTPPPSNGIMSSRNTDTAYPNGSPRQFRRHGGHRQPERQRFHGHLPRVQHGGLRLAGRRRHGLRPDHPAGPCKPSSPAGPPRSTCRSRSRPAPSLRAEAGQHAGPGRHDHHHRRRDRGPHGFTGTVSLAGNNSFSAGLNVTFGMPTPASNTALGTGNVTLAAGTTLTLNAGIKLSNQGASTLSLANATTSLVNLAGTGVQDTVAGAGGQRRRPASRHLRGGGQRRDVPAAGLPGHGRTAGRPRAVGNVDAAGRDNGRAGPHRPAPPDGPRVGVASTAKGTVALSPEGFHRECSSGEKGRPGHESVVRTRLTNPFATS